MFKLFKPRADRSCLELAGTAMQARLVASLSDFCATHETDLASIDEAIRRTVEAQMMVVSISTSLFDYCLTDAYYDTGKASVFTGRPDLRFHHDDVRMALHAAWSFFPSCKSNLDMRYRYIYVNKLLSAPEHQLWVAMERWSASETHNVFELNSPFNYDWARFIFYLSKGEPKVASELLYGR